MFIRNGTRFNVYASAEIGSVTYPNFLDAGLREQLGIQEVQEPVAPDDYSDELYYKTEQDEAPYVVYTRKSDEQIKQFYHSKAEAEARQYLLDTDWYVTRFSETGKPIPEEVVAKRAEARATI